MRVTPASSGFTPVSYTHLDVYKRQRYKCTACDYVYDPAKGDPETGIEPGTPFEEIPDDWTCPICGLYKTDFEAVEE